MLAHQMRSRKPALRWLHGWLMYKHPLGDRNQHGAADLRRIFQTPSAYVSPFQRQSPHIKAQMSIVSQKWGQTPSDPTTLFQKGFAFLMAPSHPLSFLAF